MEAFSEQLETELDEQIITNGADFLNLIGVKVLPSDNLAAMRISLAYLIGQYSAKFAAADEDFANGIVGWLAVTHDRNIIALWNRLVVSEPT